MSGFRKVPFFDYPRLYTDHKSDFLNIFDEVASRGAFISQKDVSEFESSLSCFTNANHVVGVANATDGLELAWMSIGLQPGDEVICSSHTMLATASAIKLSGGVPVPIDIGDDNLIDVDAILPAISSRTVGIMPTQLNGRTCEMDKVMNIASRHSLFVVEDAAQALGSRFKGIHAGTFGDASAISFFPAKVLGCFGDAGAVLTNNSSLFHKIHQLHDHGRDVDGEVKSWGRNSRLDNLQAAFLNYQLPNYGQTIARRRELASIYHSRLSILEELKLPPSPDSDPDHFDVYQNYELQAVNRDQLKLFLARCGIGTLIQWGGKAIHQWKNLGFNQYLPKTESFFDSCIMLPLNLFVTNDDVHYVCDCVISFYRGDS